jgi:DNA replication protein DnaC
MKLSPAEVLKQAQMSQVLSYAKQCKLAGLGKQVHVLCEEARDQQWTYEEFLLKVMEEEILHRKNSRYHKLLKQAKLPQVKTLDQFQFQRAPFLSRAEMQELHSLSFVPEASNVLFLGGQGLGKTHLLLSLAHQSCLQGYTTLFITAAQLGNQLVESQSERQLQKFLDKLRKIQVLCIDELGYVQLSAVTTQLMFQVISDRYERGSILLSSNLEFSEWTQIFHDERMTAAILDRLVHNSHIVLFKGNSFRMEESLRRKSNSSKRKEE